MKPEYHVISFSGGKDSTALLLRMLELGLQVDEVVFCDTTKEFTALLRHVDKVQKVVEAAGVKFTRLQAAYSFDYYMFTKPVKSKKTGEERNGLGWPGPLNRWCTGTLKRDVIQKYLTQLKKKYTVVEYVGIAADETKRLEKKNNRKKNHQHPLVEWGWTEKDCLNYCYSKGYDWEGLYQHYKRVSCFCCPLQTLEQLRATRTFYPDLWNKLKTMDSKARLKIKPTYSVADLEVLFDLKDEYEAAGLPTNTKAFYSDYRCRKDESNAV